MQLKPLIRLALKQLDAVYELVVGGPTAQRKYR